MQKNISQIESIRFNGCSGFYLIGPIFQVILCNFVTGLQGFTQVGIVNQMPFHSLFFVQGLFISSWKKYIHADLEHLRESVVYPFFIFSLLFFYGVCLPGNHSNVTSVYLFPIYSSYHLNVLFILGAWISVYSILWIIKSETNKEFNPAVFKMTSESSLWCYISHILFTDMLLTFFVVPYKEHLYFLPTFLVMFIFTELLCILTYVGLTKCMNCRVCR